MASIKTVLELVNSQFLSAIKQSEDAVKNFKTNVQGVGTQFANSFGAMDIAATALGASLIITGKEVMSFADEITDLATAHQEAVSQVLALSAALQANGGKAENAGRMYLEMSKAIDQANGGNLKTLQSFENLGVSMQDLGASSERDIRDKLIAGLAAIQDPAERAAKAFQIFGKAATGVDFVALGKSIEENNAKYAQHEAALKSAGDAYDHLNQIAMDTKIAFAEAFKPIFDAITKLNPSIEDITVKFKLMGAALAVITAASIARGVWALVAAFQALRVAVMANPLLAIASVLATIGVGAATYFGLLEDGTKATEENSKATDDNTDAAEKNAKVKRDQANLVVAQQKELEGLKKITEAFVRNNEQIQKKLDLELNSLTQTEEQKRVAQQLSDIETTRDKTLIDLKNQYNQLDADGRARQKKAYEEQQALIIQNAETEKNAATQSIKAIENRKRALNDITGMYNIYADSSAKILNELAVSEKLGKSAQERILIEKNLNDVISYRKIVSESAKGMLETEKYADFNQALTDILATTNILNYKGQALNDTVRARLVILAEEYNLTKEQTDALLRSFDVQGQAIQNASNDQAKFAAITREQQRSFTNGWNEAFQQYADDATNAAKQAERIFSKVTQGLEDAFVNFAKTGKLSFKDLMASITEEILRSQIRGLIGQLFGPMGGQSGASGGGLINSMFSGIGKIFGFADGGQVAGGTPILVGERGPEIFTPNSTGYITPNNKIKAGTTGDSGSGGTNVTYNINAVDAASFKAMIARDPQFIYAVTQQGRKTIPGAI